MTRLKNAKSFSLQIVLRCLALDFRCSEKRSPKYSRFGMYAPHVLQFVTKSGTHQLTYTSLAGRPRFFNYFDCILNGYFYFISKNPRRVFGIIQNGEHPCRELLKQA